MTRQLQFHCHPCDGFQGHWSSTVLWYTRQLHTAHLITSPNYPDKSLLLCVCVCVPDVSAHMHLFLGTAIKRQINK